MNMFRSFSRREMLQGVSIGFGSLALSSLLQEQSQASSPELGGCHFPPAARRLIFLFMKGGPSQVDSFDYKPKLQADDGKDLPFPKPRVQFTKTDKLLGSPWKFAPQGQIGIHVSELFPHISQCVDELCFLHSLHGTNPAHGGACLKLHTGSDTLVRPSMGSWLSYGLGSENQNLPAFVTICPTLAHGGARNWAAGFLPANCQGVPFGLAGQSSARAAVKYVDNPYASPGVQRRQLDAVAEMNREHLEVAGADPLLDARIQSFELAFRMQTAMPEAQNLSGETAETLSLYGLDNKTTEDFGRQCLLARRLIERGVRFIQVTHDSGGNQWDQHNGLKKGHEKNALETDKPVAGLLSDLKRRGLLDDTLVLWGGEFGRTPVGQERDGRDHNPEGFTMWLAGAGVKAGFRYGATDEYGYFATENKMHLHDLHATLLHLMGLDHKRLTYRHAGREFRLTDVAGKVHEALLA